MQAGLSDPNSAPRPFALVRVPFPFSDPRAEKRRPALVLSGADFQRRSGHVLLAMVTSASQIRWPLDWEIQVLSTTGLKQPCLVRMKLFTLDRRLLLGTLGHLAALDQNGVRRQLAALLADLS